MGSLIPPHALCLLPSYDSNLNALLCNLTGGPAGVVPKSLRNQFLAAYSSDVVAKQHLPTPSSLRSCDSVGLLLHKGLIYVPESLRMNVLQEHHDAPLASHSGISRTLELVTRNYWFPGINAFVKDYVNSCYSCQQAKAPRHPRHGELASLPVPTSPWKGLSCDFITDLPVSNGMDSILVFVDRMTKMVHFIPCTKTTDAPEFAPLFVSNVVRLHSLPASLFPTEVPSLHHIFGQPLLRSSRLTPANLPPSIPRPMGKQSVRIKLWKPTSVSPAATTKTTGSTSCPSLNLCTTTPVKNLRK
jgi:Integrase zinc binding domain